MLVHRDCGDFTSCSLWGFLCGWQFFPINQIKYWIIDVLSAGLHKSKNQYHYEMPVSFRSSLLISSYLLWTWMEGSAEATKKWDILCTIECLCNVIDKTALKKAEVSPLKSPCSTILNSCYKWLGTLWIKDSCSLFPLALGKGCSSSLWLCDFSAVFKSHSQDGWPPWHPSPVPTSCFLPGLAKGDMSLWLKYL